MSILDFDGFLIWVSMDFWFGFCAAVLSLTLLMTARGTTTPQMRRISIRVNESNNNPLTYVSDKTVITTNILAGTIFPL